MITLLLAGGYIIYQYKIYNDLDKKCNDTNQEEKKDESASNTNETETIKGGYLFSENSLSKYQRYQLVVVSGGERTAFNNIDSTNDTYYLLDMQKLGTSEDVKKIDLVSIMKPITDEAIKSKMPSSSTSASGTVTNLNQCNSFSISYVDPVESGKILQSYGLNLEKDVPIAVTYGCNTDNYSVGYHQIVYVLDTETNTVREFGVQ